MENSIVEILALDEEVVGELTELLVEVVNDGASIGFLAPLEPGKAREYWLSVPGAGVRLLQARRNGKLVGTVQLQLCMKENGSHRAEVAKLMVHRAVRRAGVAKSLMAALEKLAQDDDRKLLVLDTRARDPSNLLYQSLGYIGAGSIPAYARSSAGGYDATVFYYKFLDEALFHAP